MKSSTWITSLPGNLKRLASWETIPTIKASGCMKLFKATRRQSGEVTCFLFPPAKAIWRKRKDLTTTLEITSNFAVLSKA